MTRLMILAALAAFSLMGQAVTAKPETAKPAEPVAATPVSPVAPAINSAKLWRLVSKTQAIRTQLESSELGRAVKEAEAELQAEQGRLAALCGPGFILDYERDPKSASFQDVVCSPKPKETSAATAPEVKK